MLAGLASLLLLVAAMAYASHHHDEAEMARSTGECGLCALLGSVAGPPTPVPAVVAVTTDYLLPALFVVLSLGFLGSVRARGPPASLHN
jgi:hypothetical protein